MLYQYFKIDVFHKMIFLSDRPESRAVPVAVECEIFTVKGKMPGSWNYFFENEIR